MNDQRSQSSLSSQGGALPEQTVRTSSQSQRALLDICLYLQQTYPTFMCSISTGYTSLRILQTNSGVKSMES